MRLTFKTETDKKHQTEIKTQVQKVKLPRETGDGVVPLSSGSWTD